MAWFKISLNLEFCCPADKSFEAGVGIASKLGCRWIEPMVHTDREIFPSAECGKIDEAERSISYLNKTLADGLSDIPVPAQPPASVEISIPRAITGIIG